MAAALCPFFHRSHSSAFCAVVNQIRDVTMAKSEIGSFRAKIESLRGAHELEQRYREALFGQALFDVLPFNLVQLGFE
jgi:hypothetical protein